MRQEVALGLQPTRRLLHQFHFHYFHSCHFQADEWCCREERLVACMATTDEDTHEYYGST